MQAKNSSNEMNQLHVFFKENIYNKLMYLIFYEFFGLDISKFLAHYGTVRCKR